MIKLPWRRTKRSRGQALVEFAIILPVLALLLMLALDFGRVFFGWVALNNAARIAANAAAVSPDAWSGGGNPGLQASYRQQVINDLNAINCRPGSGNPQWQASDVPNPTYDGSASQYTLDHHVAVTLNCRFTFLTPLVGNILSNALTIVARSDFTIRGGMVAGVPIGASPPPAGCVDAVVPSMIGQSVSGARTAWFSAGFNAGTFTPASGSDTESVLTQTTSPASSPGDCLVKTAVVIVTFTVNGCTPPSVKVPNLVGMTVSAARSAWSSAGFNVGTFSPASGSDTDTVTTQTTSPSSSPGQCEPLTTTVTVTHVAPSPPPATCTMPQLVGLKVNGAQTAFTAGGFTGAFTIARPPNGNYDVTSQNRVGGQQYPCTTDVTVSGIGLTGGG